MSNGKENRRLKGAQAEDVVRKMLEKQGWKILGTNFQTRFGEIDIIAEEGRSLVFVEVKSSSRPNETLLSKVNSAKQRRMTLTANQYLIENETDMYLEVRFDVLALTKTVRKEWSVEHIRNAFSIEAS